MNEAELDRLRRELPGLVGDVVRALRAMVAAVNAPHRDQVLCARRAEAALARADKWLTAGGGEGLLAEAMRRDVEVEA